MAETPRAGTFYDKDGDRWYKAPGSPTSAYAGVTSVLGSRNKSFLSKAKVNGIAKYAAKNRVALSSFTQAGVVSLLKSQDETLPDWKVARDYGNAAHKVLDNHLTGQDLDKDLVAVEATDTYPCANTFTEWVPKYWEEFCSVAHVVVVHNEFTCFSHRFGYAGSGDLMLWVDGKLTIVDAKSNKGGPSKDVALQNRAYGNTDEICDMETGNTVPMPQVEASAVLWLREEGWAYVELPYKDDNDELWRTFYAHLLVHKFGKKKDGDVVGTPKFGTLEIPRRWGE